MSLGLQRAAGVNSSGAPAARHPQHLTAPSNAWLGIQDDSVPNVDVPTHDDPSSKPAFAWKKLEYLSASSFRK